MLRFALAGLLALCSAAYAETFGGPVAVRVVEVLDGDTFVADALVWPGHTVRINVRVRGIDAPEMRARCPAERQAALQARMALSALLGGPATTIRNIAGAKYYGRVLADVSAGGVDVAPRLLSVKLARAYKGGRRVSWCDLAPPG